MKQVFTSPQDYEVDMLKIELEREGIHCYVDNKVLRNLAGELAYADVWQKLYVAEENYEKAMKLTAYWRIAREQEAPSGNHWQCNHCGEENEGQFILCWNCSKENE